MSVPANDASVPQIPFDETREFTEEITRIVTGHNTNAENLNIRLGGLLNNTLYLKDEIDKMGTGVPTGTIISWTSQTPPNGFLECAGQIVSQATYPDLYEVLGISFNTGEEGTGNFRLPNLRGEFLRGWDHERGIDSGRKLGSFQLDEIKSHNHSGVPLKANDLDRGIGNASWFSIDALGSTDSTGGTETRPRNISVMYCIKATDMFLDATQTSISELAQELAEKANISGTRLWKSSEYTPIANSKTVATHNLNIDPMICRCDVQLVCKVAEGGYSVGDTAISLAIGIEPSNISYMSLPPIPLLKTNTIQINTGNGVFAQLRVINKENGSQVPLTLANWRYVFRIWY